MKITIPESHEVVLRLPSDVPPGEAEIIVLAKGRPGTADQHVDEWLRKLAEGIPPSPVIPLDALRRENLYE
jgi:hypothetical protein